MVFVKVSWEDQFGTSRSCPARMEDRSLSGARVRLRMPIAIGTKLKIESSKGQFSGIVAYCRSDRTEYVLGIQRDSLIARFPSISAQQANPAVHAPVSPLESSSRAAHQLLAAKILAMPHMPTAKPDEIPLSSLAIENVPFANVALSLLTFDQDAHHRVTQTGETLRIPQSRDFNTFLGLQLEKQTPSPGKETTHMQFKWMNDALWRRRQVALSQNSSVAPIPADAVSTPSPVDDAALASAAPGNLMGAQDDLMSTCDIYRSAGIMSPRMGYTITKVADMLDNSHLHGLPDSMKRASIFMALDAAGVPVEDVLRDATLRQDAIDSYESAQRKLFEEFWAQKEEENSLIQSELDRLTALLLDRIKRNLDEVSREKITFATWQSTKQQESQRIAEAVALCSPERAFASDEPEGRRTLAARST